MWVEFVVGPRSCPEDFSPGSPVFLPPQKPIFINSNSIGNSRATGLSVSVRAGSHFDISISRHTQKQYDADN